MAFKVEKKGNYIFIEDLSNNTLYDYKADELTIDKPTDTATTYNFIYRGKPLAFLTNIPIADIKDKDEVVYSVADWENFYRHSSNQYSTEDDISNSTVTVSKTTAIKLLGFNWDRKGVSFHNDGGVDICIRFKEAATDNNIEGIVLKAGDSLILDSLSYIGEISAIRTTTQGTQTADVELVEW